MSTPYGTDLFLVIGSDGSMDVDPTMREVSGLQTLVQSLVMRQFTPTGSVIAAPDDCIDIRQWLSKGMTASDVQQLAATVQAQLLRDPRVKSAQVSGLYNLTTNAITLTENITAGSGPFALVVSVSNLSISVLLNGVPLGGGVGSITPTPTASTPATATGIPGPAGPPGATGPQGPAGPPGGSLTPILATGPATIAAVAGNLYIVDLSGGAVVLNLPALAVNASVGVQHVKGTPSSANSLTINAPAGVQLQELPPNNGSSAASFVFQSATDFGVGLTFTNFGTVIGGTPVYATQD